MIYKDLKGKKLELDNNLLFQFSKTLFNKEITIVDMEMNGTKGKYSEIIEFCGIKVKNGIILDTYDFKCRHTKYGIHKELIEKNIIDFKDYESRNTINPYTDDLIKFLDNSIIFLWGSGYDRITLINLFNRIKKQEILKNIQYIDFQNCIKKTNPDLFGERDYALDELFNNLITYRNDNNIEEKDFWKFIKDLKNNYHSAENDVWKLIFLILGYNDEIGYINWERQIRNIRANFVCRKNKIKNKPIVCKISTK